MRLKSIRPQCDGLSVLTSWEIVMIFDKLSINILVAKGLTTKQKRNKTNILSVICIEIV